MKSNDNYLNILRHNGGFHPVEKWLQYAEKNNFKKTISTKLKSCPDCNNGNLIKFGQYIYYSNIIHIKNCPNCGLYFSDTLLDQEVIAQHFENSYKDELYFESQRKYIFKHIASLANKFTKENGSLLDIGGGKGHVLNNIKNRRPDIHVTLNDLSRISCDYCSEAYGIKSICCGIPSLQKLNVHFNTILMIDVIYYEPKLNEMFSTISKLLEPDEQSTLIIRVPNKLRLIVFCQSLLNLFGSSRKLEFQGSVKYFNPEHIYIFSKSYLKCRLKELGFNRVTFIPSPLLSKANEKEGFYNRIFFQFANVICKLTAGKMILSPSMVVIAKKNMANKPNEIER